MYKILQLGMRPEIIKLSRIIDKFDKIFNHKLIHTVKILIMNLMKFF